MTRSPDAPDTEDIYAKLGTPDRVTVRLNKAGWRKHTAKVGVHTDSVLGQMLGFTPSSVWRIKCGRNAPSSDFIAQSMSLLDAPFDELFEVVPLPKSGRRGEKKDKAGVAA